MPFFDDFTRNVIDSLPPKAQALHENLESIVQSLIQSALAHLSLVTREEFELQTAVLQRTREKVEQLEARFNALAASHPNDTKDTGDMEGVGGTDAPTPTDASIPTDI